MSHNGFLTALILLVIYCSVIAPASAQPPQQVHFKRHVVDAAPPPQPYYKMVGDVNGDKRPDIVVAGRAGPLVVYAGPHWKKSTIAKQGYNGGVNGELADIDGDGDLDIAMGGVVWFSNPRHRVGQAVPDTPWNMHRIDHQAIHDVEAADLGVTPHGAETELRCRAFSSCSLRHLPPNRPERRGS